MPANRGVRINANEIDVPPPRAVAIRNASLVNGLIRNRDETLELLNRVAPVAIEDITVDERGRVLVNSEPFADGLRAGGLGPDAAAGNGVCGAGC